MLSTFRKMAKSKITLIILGVPLVAGLLIFGNVRDVFGNMSGRDAVVSAKDRAVSSAEFKQAFDSAREGFEQRAGRPVTVAEAAAQGGVEDVVEGLAGREGFMAAITRAGVRPSDKLIVDQLRKIPAFFDPVTGRFDEKLYNQKLGQAGLTAPAFEKSLRDEIAQNQFSSAVAAGLRAPAIYSAVTAALSLEQRSFSAFAIDPASLPAPAKPTDAQLETFLKTQAEQLRRPESRALTVVRFSAKAIETTIPVDPAELQKRFEFRKDTLSQPEKRTVVQIPAKDAAGAAAIAARLNKGEDPAVVAKALGVEPVTYADTPKSAISDPRIADAAFALAAGKASAPVQGGLGWAVVKVTAVTPGKTVALDQVRPALEAELRAEAAQERIYDVVEKYTAAHEGGATLVEAAKTAGVTALQLPPVSARGVDAQGRPNPNLTEKLIKAAFELPEGGESDVVDDGKGEYFAVRVDKVFASALPALKTERPLIEALYMRVETGRLLQARVDALAEQVRKGQSMDAVAAAAGAKINRLTLDRRMAEQSSPQQRPLFNQVFGKRPGEVFTLGSGVVKVETVKPGSVQMAALMTRVGQTQQRSALFQDIGEEAFKWTRKAMKVKTDIARARAALGLPAAPETAPGKSEAPAK